MQEERILECYLLEIGPLDGNLLKVIVRMTDGGLRC
jgi:hypothetical protein